MKAGGSGKDPRAKVDVRCLCGTVHSMPREKVLGRLGRDRWRCAGCKRRFVVACTPGTAREPERFWPLFLEDVPPTGDTQQIAIASDGSPSAPVPPRLHFRCACGCRLVGESRLYGTRTSCPKCHIRLVVRVGYDSDTGKPVPLLEYLDSTRLPKGRGRKP
jgi:hypothetical protein